MGSREASRTAGLRRCCRASRWRLGDGELRRWRKACRCRSRRRSPRATARRAAAAAGGDRRRPARSRAAPEQTSSGFPSIFKPPAMFGKSGEATAFDAKQRAWSTGSAPISPACSQLSRQIRSGRPRRRQIGRRVLPAEARQGPLRIQSAEPDRDDRRRLLGGGARPQARDPGSLSAVADAAAFPAGRPHRSVARHQRRSASMPTTCSSPW